MRAAISVSSPAIPWFIVTYISLHQFRQHCGLERTLNMIFHNWNWLDGRGKNYISYSR
jgi:hypothetical protein